MTAKMKRPFFIVGAACLSMLVSCSGGTEQCDTRFNRAPLAPRAYAELPLGTIKAEGWLYEMLDRQRKGMTGNLDELYPLVMGKRNGWLGGACC